MDESLSYSLAVFFIVLISGLVLNLLKKHYVFQLLGISFFFMSALLRTVRLINSNPEITFKAVFMDSLPSLMGISACQISMFLGFWLFPLIRRRLKD